MFFGKQDDDAASVTSASPRSRPNTSTSRKPPSRQSDATDEGTTEGGSQGSAAGGHFDIPKGSLSISRNPKAAAKLINMFLLICSRLELLKTDWVCRKLGTNEVSTTKQYRKFW